jgi:hypothetical protein
MVRANLGQPCGYCREKPATTVHHYPTVDRKGMIGIDARACCQQCADVRSGRLPRTNAPS